MDLLATFHVIDGATNRYTVILAPHHLFGEFVLHSLEKQHLRRTPRNKHLIIKHHHLPERFLVPIVYFLHCVILHIINIDCECLAAAVERVDFAIGGVIEAIIGKIAPAIKSHLVNYWLDFAGFMINSNKLATDDIPKEMVVRVRVVVEEVDEQEAALVAFVDERAGYEWVIKLIIGHGVPVDVEPLVYLQLRPINFFLIPFRAPEHSAKELAIVVVNYGKQRAGRILFYSFHLYIIFLYCRLLVLVSNHFLKSLLQRANIIHFDIIAGVMTLG